MTVSGVSSVSLGSQTWQQEFEQLGKDLQSGNLTAAQADFKTLEQPATPGTSSPTTSTTNPPPGNSSVVLALSQLNQDLKAGNLTAAQQDFSTLQQDLGQSGQTGQNGRAEGHHHHHHHHHHHFRHDDDDDGQGQASTNGQIGQLMGQLGQELRAGDLAGALKTYGTLSQDFAGSSQAPPQSSNPTPITSAPTSGTGGLSVSA